MKTDTDFKEILKALKAPFPAPDHKDRDLPGGGRWFFISWQKVKERLDDVYPEWSCTYSDPVIAGDLITVRCQLCIAGVMREGMGNSDAIGERTKAGTYKFGSPVEKATADAFKNAAEQFGVGAYLDDQDLVIRHLRTAQDMRAHKYAQENNWKAAGAMGTPKKKTSGTPTTKNPIPDRDQLMERISAQMQRLGWTPEMGKQHLERVYQVKSRALLSLIQLSEFLAYLESDSTPGARV